MGIDYDEIDLIDIECPRCDQMPTYSRECSVIGCDEGFINLYEEDPLWYDADDYEMCDECWGTGVLHWCPSCGFDIQKYEAMMSNLTFSELRRKNVARCNDVFHPVSDWSITDWATAFAGEAGEACNEVKKLRRLGPNVEFTSAEQHVDAIADELADTIIYVDLLAARLGIDLGKAIQEKFNEVSEREGSEIRL